MMSIVDMLGCEIVFRPRPTQGFAPGSHRRCTVRCAWTGWRTPVRPSDAGNVKPPADRTQRPCQRFGSTTRSTPTTGGRRRSTATRTCRRGCSPHSVRPRTRRRRRQLQAKSGPVGRTGARPRPADGCGRHLNTRANDRHIRILWRRPSVRRSQAATITGRRPTMDKLSDPLAEQRVIFAESEVGDVRAGWGEPPHPRGTRPCGRPGRIRQ
jgi:hypothetical protein